MSRSALLGTLFTTAIALCPTLASAQGTASGLAFGVRTGYALSAGKIGTLNQMNDGGDLSDRVSGMIPLQLDLGYRLNPNILVGGFFQYGFGFINTDQNPNCNGCSVHDIALGAAAYYHFLPAAPFDPWAGVAVGYEFLGLDTANTVLGQTLTSHTNVKGFQYLTLQFGGDFMASPTFAVGPFIDFSFGEYASWSSSGTALGTTSSSSGDISNTKLHEWLTLGIRGQFNL